jgi:hypothetical protein
MFLLNFYRPIFNKGFTSLTRQFAKTKDIQLSFIYVEWLFLLIIVTLSNYNRRQTCRNYHMRIISHFNITNDKLKGY